MSEDIPYTPPVSPQELWNQYRATGASFDWFVHRMMGLWQLPEIEVRHKLREEFGLN